ncbi:CRISPR-associated endoribonuclease Cas6 [Oceanithermus sp.]
MVHLLKIRLAPDRPGSLPLAYREAIQGLIYNLLPRKLSLWLHEEGLPTTQGYWKPFVFSRLSGKLKPDIGNKSIRLTGPVYFKLASPLPEVVGELGKAFLLARRIELAGLSFTHEELTMEEITPPPSPTVLVARSPITVFRKENGRRRYFRPEEPEFVELLVRNIRMKAEALGKSRAGEVVIEPLGVTTRHKKIERFRRLIIEGWMGRYRFSAPSELTWVALTSGLGALGSQGFGFVEVGRD